MIWAALAAHAVHRVHGAGRRHIPAVCGGNTMKKAKVKFRALKQPFNLAAQQERMRRRHGDTVAKADVSVTRIPSKEERYYSVSEVAELWNLSENTVRNVFSKVPGVLKIGSKKYKTLRVPAKVLRETTAKLSACKKRAE
jgi:hypothetical protein